MCVANSTRYTSSTEPSSSSLTAAASQVGKSVPSNCLQDIESSGDKAKVTQQQLEQQQQHLAQQLQQLKADEAKLATQKLQLQV